MRATSEFANTEMIRELTDSELNTVAGGDKCSSGGSTHKNLTPEEQRALQTKELYEDRT